MNKMILGFLIILVASPVFALSNAELRSTLQSVIDFQKFPQQVDELTTLVAMETTTRGIAYTYQLSMLQDEFPLASMNILKLQTIKTLCTQPAMTLYKSNDVEIINYYFDSMGELISLFKVTSSDC
jgi:CHASE3 domain sensor protein